MSDFHIVVFFNDYYTLIVAFLMKQIQNRYRYRRLPDSPNIHQLFLVNKLRVHTSEHLLTFYLSCTIHFGPRRPTSPPPPVRPTCPNLTWICYRSGMVNSKSFIGKVLLRIKWKFELDSNL